MTHQAEWMSVDIADIRMYSLGLEYDFMALMYQ